MTKKPRTNRVRHSAPESSCLVQWILRRGHESVTCQVDVHRNGTSRYEVAVVPHWNVASTTIEAAASPLTALQRHAEIAHHLRENGWSVARRTT